MLVCGIHAGRISGCFCVVGCCRDIISVGCLSSYFFRFMPQRYNEFLYLCHFRFSSNGFSGNKERIVSDSGDIVISIMGCLRTGRSDVAVCGRCLSFLRVIFIGCGACCIAASAGNRREAHRPVGFPLSQKVRNDAAILWTMAGCVICVCRNARA